MVQCKRFYPDKFYPHRILLESDWLFLPISFSLSPNQELSPYWLHCSRQILVLKGQHLRQPTKNWHPCQLSVLFSLFQRHFVSKDELLKLISPNLF